MNQIGITIGAIVVTAAVLGNPTTITAAELLHVRSVVDLTFAEPGLTALCGFDVYRNIAGMVDAILFLDDDGDPLREIDTSPSLRYTFLAPASGKFISYPGTGTLLTDYYPDGTAVATVDGHLTFGHVPGAEPLLINVGRLMFTADVVGTSADGLPVIGPPIDILFEAGVDHGSVLGACEALAP
jgi:hypothetical protein